MYLRPVVLHTSSNSQWLPMGRPRTRENFHAASASSLARRMGTTSLRGLAVAVALFALMASAGCIGLTGSSPLAPSGAKDINVNPSPLGFGNVVVGTTNSQPMILSNTGKTDLTIRAVAISGKGFSASGIATPLMLGAGQSANLQRPSSRQPPELLLEKSPSRATWLS